MIIYTIIGLIYADFGLIVNITMKSEEYDQIPLVIKLLCYLADIVMWPILMINDVINQFKEA